MKKILLTLPVLLVFISSNCEKEYQDFIIENNSDESIVISYGFSSHYKDETYLLVHPEAETTNEYKNYLRRRRVPPHSSKNMGESLGERMINSSHSSDTMYLCFIYQADIETLLSNIDIGGVTLLRAGAKNYKNVIVVCDREDYNLDFDNVDEITRQKLALKVFNKTSKYDFTIKYTQLSY